MSTSTKAKLSVLELVFPPISNQLAVWVENDKEAEPYLRQSDFYMIGARAEARFLDFAFDRTTECLTFKIRVGETFVDDVVLNMRTLSSVAEDPGETYSLEPGDEIIRIWSGPPHEADSKVLDWFTTERLIWERSRDREGIEAFERVAEAATYDLLYVGIAKVGDSYDRLIRHGHKARMDVLANEPQRFPGARVTDEIFLFLFQVQPTIIATYDLDHEFTGDELSGEYDAKRIVADAEKAFVSLLKPQYNAITFANYPKGRDGLFGSDYDRYGYTIGENLTFNTAHGRFRGGRDVHGFISNRGDSIFVDGETVKVFQSGVDYPEA